MALYTPKPKADPELGTRPEDFENEPPLEVWPDVWPAMELLDAMGTQWRQGPGGRTGLDYNALPFVLRMRGVPRADWPQLFEDLAVMETAVLEMPG